MTVSNSEDSTDSFPNSRNSPFRVSRIKEKNLAELFVPGQISSFPEFGIGKRGNDKTSFRNTHLTNTDAYNDVLGTISAVKT